MGRERLTARSAPIELLVRSSSDIVLGTLEWPPDPGGGWRRQLHALEWLRASGRETSGAVGRVPLYMGIREDSLARRWNECPPDLEAGGRPGDTLRVFAFLRYAHDPLPHLMPRAGYRPAEPRYGILLADPATERRVRAAVSRWRNQPLEPSRGCGASLSEFTRPDPTEAAGVGIKLTPVSAYRLPILAKRRTLTLGCVPSHEPVLSSLSPGWFCPCLLPDHRYAADLTAAQGVLLRPEQMSVLLDSVATCLTQHPVIGEGDSMTVTLRRVRNGEERIYEAAVDGDAFMTIVRTLAALFPSRENRPLEAPVYPRPSTPESIIRTNLVSWTRAVDPRCAPLWND